MKKNLKELLAELRLKATPKRLAILDILAEASTYLSPEEVWKALGKRFANIGLPTVYRNLEQLSNGSLISKILHPDRKLYYYYCRNDRHHHHFICTGCRKVEDLFSCGAEKIEDEVRTRLKGSVVSHLLQVYGLCSNCGPQGTSRLRCGDNP